MESRILGLYLGCEAMVTYPFEAEFDFKIRLVGIDHEGNPLGVYEGDQGFPRRQTIEVGKIKLLLRPLSSMTEEEGMEIFGSEWNSDSPNARDVIKNIQADEELRLTPTETKTLLSKGFDLFGLIEKQEAIDSTKL